MSLHPAGETRNSPETQEELEVDVWPTLLPSTHRALAQDVALPQPPPAPGPAAGPDPNPSLNPDRGHGCARGSSPRFWLTFCTRQWLLERAGGLEATPPPGVWGGGREGAAGREGARSPGFQAQDVAEPKTHCRV